VRRRRCGSQRSVGGAERRVSSGAVRAEQRMGKGRRRITDGFVLGEDDGGDGFSSVGNAPPLLSVLIYYCSFHLPKPRRSTQCLRLMTRSPRRDALLSKRPPCRLQSRRRATTSTTGRLDALAVPRGLRDNHGIYHAMFAIVISTFH
jgi:hypothetical protein